MNQEKTTAFSGYGLSEEVQTALRLLGYHTPTQVQEQVIPLIMEGRDVAVKSKTGTGKTAAFAIPICHLTAWEENAPQALVLEPTRELAVQVRDELFHIGRKKRLKVPAVFGGFPIDKQIQTLKQKSHVVVGTPGRIMDHIRRESIKLQQVRYLVIDEADLMLDMGFLEDVRQIMGHLPEEKQIMLFSATLGDRIQELMAESMPSAVSVILEAPTETAEGVEQEVYEVGNDDKYDVMLDILIKENPDDCMIFCGTREMVNVLYRKMQKDRIPCGMIHGELNQSERLKTIEAFRDGRIHYLIATDVAARGVDFDNITHVINYDFPTGRETFVHRVGRTGRNGKTGKAISFVSDDDRKMRLMVEEFIGETLPVYQCPQRDQEKEKAFRATQKQKTAPKIRKGAALNRSIMKLSIGGGKKSKMRTVDIVGTICSIETVEAEDIGIIDIRDSLTYVEILNGKGEMVLDALQEKTIKGKVRKVRKTRG